MVLLPDLYYRVGPYPPMNPREVLANPELMGSLIKNVAGLDRDRKISDTAAWIEFLMSRPEVEGDRYGVTVTAWEATLL